MKPKPRGGSSRPAVAAKPPDPATLIRINRYLSMCGETSRRKAEDLVLNGRVAVNGRVVTNLATKVDPRRDRVALNGHPLTLLEDTVYLVMNKPKDALTTMSDERGGTTVMDLLKTRKRVFPVGRLDRNTTGILLFTNDGEFAHRLMHPRFEIPKCYHVTCSRTVTVEHLQQLRRGVRLGDGVSGPAEVELVRGGRGKEVGIVIREGRNREVRRMFEALGYEVLKLDRVAYGPVTKEGLARSETRSLTRGEVRKLMALAGMEEKVDTGEGARMSATRHR